MEVRVTKCKNGHYYDANKHPECPHCGAPSILDGVQVTNGGQKKGLNLFKKKRQEEVRPLEERPKLQPEKPQNSKVQVEDIVVTDSAHVLLVEDVVTEGTFSDSEGYEAFQDEVTEAFFSQENESFLEVEEVCIDEPKMIQPVVGEQGVSLKAEVESVKADNDAKTIGFFAAYTASKEELEPISTLQSVAPVQTVTNEPVVGWLVCIKGAWIGREFKLVTGRNSIGRSETNVICLNNENSVSREKHAWIVYEPRKRQFFIQPGESSGLTYVNDDTVLEPKQLCSGDILEFGETKFIFIPLCGETFSWDEYFTTR